MSRPEIDQPRRFAVRAPVRMADVGGWTDTWFSGRGRVTSIAVRPGVRISVTVNPNTGTRRDRVRILALDYGQILCFSPSDRPEGRHALLKGAVHLLPPPENLDLEIAIRSAVPAGSATGTSASVCVALLFALSEIRGRRLPPGEAARLAHRVETDLLRLQSGVQDQLAAAYGGINRFEIDPYPETEVIPLRVPPDRFGQLEKRLFLIYLGSSHFSSPLHDAVIASLEKRGGGSCLAEMRSLAAGASAALESGDLEGYGRILVRNNELKRRLHPGLISADADRVIAEARKYDAAGWKVNGAGGPGGSLTILGSSDAGRRRRMIRAILGLGGGIRPLRFRIAKTGAGILRSGPPGPRG